MSRDALRHVASLLGIAIRHVDALGVWHEPDDETLARLITAFGLPEDPKRAAETLVEQQQAAPFGLAPMQILAEEDPAPKLTLRLPPGVEAVEWHCRTEAGGAHDGRSAGGDLRLPGGLPAGYHRLQLAAAGKVADIDLVVAPASCHLPEALQPGARSWGVAVQLYGLRSARNWGIGDFTDLAELCRRTGALGGEVVGINPLHALFAAEPRHFSPYSPSSRAWLNYLYIDPAAVPGFREDAAARALASPAALGRARDGELIDYAAVAAAKRPVLETLFRRFQTHDLRAGTWLGAAFRAFQREGGAALHDFAVFEMLHELWTQRGGLFSWHSWPSAMRDPHSAEVEHHARVFGDRVEFFQFLQWLADGQLGAAAAAGRDAGLALGLYRDLAVGVNPNGADAWADQELIVPGAAIGAPPDPLSRAGQDWGLAPLNPLALRRRGFAPLIAALRANMRHAGVLRIDHVMGLRRLYWIPSGSPPTAGAYVDYPFQDVLRLVALESRRHGCAVIGEDLGTLPDGFRETMQQANVLSYRVLAFERHADRSFKPPGEYAPLAAASAATHDLATLKGFWLGRDIAWRRRLGLYPDAAAEKTEIAERARDRRLLLDALAREGLLGRERFSEFLPDCGEPAYGDALGEAILVYLGRSRARLALVQLEDIVGETEQANLPGTDDQHPNWRRRSSVPLEKLLAGPALARVATLLAEARRQSAGQAQYPLRP